MKSDTVPNQIIQVYTSVIYECSKIENIPYNLIFITKFNDTSILITIISWDYLNLSVANEYVGDVRIPNQVIKYNHIFCRWVSQSDCNIHIKLNYCHLICTTITLKRRTK